MRRIRHTSVLIVNYILSYNETSAPDHMTGHDVKTVLPTIGSYSDKLRDLYSAQYSCIPES